MAHGRDESANSCTMCGFNYVLKKRARFYELISYRGTYQLDSREKSIDQRFDD